jgi:hypothetical protein
MTHGPAKYRACALDIHEKLPPGDHRLSPKVQYRTRRSPQRQRQAHDSEALVKAWEAPEPGMPRNEVSHFPVRRLQGVHSSKWALLDALDAHACAEGQRTMRAAHAAAGHQLRQALDQQMAVRSSLAARLSARA